MSENNNYRTCCMSNGLYSSSFIRDETEKIMDVLEKVIAEIKYFHKYEEDGYFVGCIDFSRFKRKSIDEFITVNNSIINYKKPFVKMDDIININIECELCDKFIDYKIELNKPIDLGHCEYYINPVLKIQRYWRLYKKFPTLWKISEYYTSKKYSPNNILKYIDLNN